MIVLWITHELFLWEVLLTVHETDWQLDNPVYNEVHYHRLDKRNPLEVCGHLYRLQHF